MKDPIMMVGLVHTYRVNGLIYMLQNSIKCARREVLTIVFVVPNGFRHFEKSKKHLNLHQDMMDIADIFHSKRLVSVWRRGRVILFDLKFQRVKQLYSMISFDDV